MELAQRVTDDEVLERFKGVDDIREYLNKSMRAGVSVVCSDGHTMAYINSMGYRAESQAPVTVAKLLGQMKETFDEYPPTFIDLPVSKIEKIQCGECDGTGYKVVCVECGGSGEVDLENDFNFYPCIECRTCHGRGDTKHLVAEFDNKKVKCDGCEEGKVFEYEPIFIDGVNVAPRLLSRIADLEGVQVAGDPGKCWLLFEYGGVRGAIMGMRW